MKEIDKGVLKETEISNLVEIKQNRRENEERERERELKRREKRENEEGGF